MLSLWKCYSKNIGDHIALLKADFNGLAILLSNVNDAVCQLKAIYLEVEYDPLVLIDHSDIIKTENHDDLFEGRIEAAQLSKREHKNQIYQRSQTRLMMCLQSLNKCLFDFFPNFYQHPLVVDSQQANRIHYLMNKQLSCDESIMSNVPVEDIVILFATFDSAVEKLILVGKNEVSIPYLL